MNAGKALNNTKPCLPICMDKIKLNGADPGDWERRPSELFWGEDVDVHNTHVLMLCRETNHIPAGCSLGLDIATSVDLANAGVNV